MTPRARLAPVVVLLASVLVILTGTGPAAAHGYTDTSGDGRLDRQ